MQALMYAVLVPALLPVYFIIRYIYKQDKTEREPLNLVLRVILFGALFSLADIPAEDFAANLIQSFYPGETVQYEIAENFFGVALIEEFTKWIVLFIFVWKARDFDYKFDGIVYAVSASLGFAGLENIIYILRFGTGVAVTRALFSIPGHAAFGIFMGFCLSRAKHCKLEGMEPACIFFMLLSLALPMCIHGMYDFLLSPAAQAQNYTGYFYVLVAVIDVAAWFVIKFESKTDKPL